MMIDDCMQNPSPNGRMPHRIFVVALAPSSLIVASRSPRISRIRSSSTNSRPACAEAGPMPTHISANAAIAAARLQLIQTDVQAAEEVIVRLTGKALDDHALQSRLLLLDA